MCVCALSRAAAHLPACALRPAAADSKIYTRASNVLISINPFAAIDGLYDLPTDPTSKGVDTFGASSICLSCRRRRARAAGVISYLACFSARAPAAARPHLWTVRSSPAGGEGGGGWGVGGLR